MSFNYQKIIKLKFDENNSQELDRSLRLGKSKGLN